MLKHLMFGVLALTLIGCPFEVTPKSANQYVASGESMVFTAISNNPAAELVWTLDGQQVAVGQEFTLVAVNESDEPIIHVLVVTAEGGPKVYPHESARWIITILPQGWEHCYVDKDHDGYGKSGNTEDPLADCVARGGDCDDGNPDTYPGAPEIMDDGLDNDCDGLIDREPPDDCCTEGDVMATYCGVGACAAKGTMTCLNCEWSDKTCVPGPPTPEVCDGIDNDCNGAVDDGIAAVPVMCPDGRTCAMECRSYPYNCCDAIPPFPEEVCDGIDNDCDGMVDEGLDDCQPVAAPPALKAQPDYCTGN